MGAALGQFPLPPVFDDAFAHMFHGLAGEHGTAFVVDLTAQTLRQTTGHAEHFVQCGLSVHRPGQS